MRVATHQPLFLLWPGLFFKRLSADVLVLLDKVQFPLGRSWMTRNRLKSDQGELWLRVPVQKKGRGKQIIRQVETHSELKWHQKHLQSIRQNYAHAPYLADHLPALEAIYAQHSRRLSALNYAFIRYLWEALGLKSTLILQSDLAASGQGTELLVSICRTLRADTYTTLPPAEKYTWRGKNLPPTTSRSSSPLSTPRFIPDSGGTSATIFPPWICSSTAVPKVWKPSPGAQSANRCASMADLKKVLGIKPLPLIAKQRILW